MPVTTDAPTVDKIDGDHVGYNSGGADNAAPTRPPVTTGAVENLSPHPFDGGDRRPTRFP